MKCKRCGAAMTWASDGEYMFGCGSGHDLAGFWQSDACRESQLRSLPGGPDSHTCAACRHWHADRPEPAGRWGATVGEALCECDRLTTGAGPGYSQGDGACRSFAPRINDAPREPVQGVLL